MIIAPETLPRGAESFRVLLNKGNEKILISEWMFGSGWTRSIESLSIFQGVDVSFIATSIPSNHEGLVDRYNHYHDSYYPALFWHSVGDKWKHVGGNVKEYAERRGINLQRLLTDKLVEYVL